MARVDYEGFEDGNPSNFFSSTTGTVTASTTFARTGQYSVKMAGVSLAVFQLLSSMSEAYLQIGNYMPTVGSPSTSPFINMQNGSTQGIRLQRSAGGVLQIIKGGSATVLASSPIAYPLDVYHYVEIHIVVALAGTFTVKQDGVQVINYSGDTRPGSNTTITNVQLASGGADMYFDDIIWNDTTGLADNSWIGGEHVDVCLANLNGDTVDWTPNGAASNYQCVDERPSDGDTSYVEAAAAGLTDLYQHAAFSATGRTITRVRPRLTARGTAGGEQLKPIIKNSGGIDQGSTKTLTTSYARIVGTDYTTNPATAAAWNESEVNSTQLGQDSV